MKRDVIFPIRNLFATVLLVITLCVPGSGITASEPGFQAQGQPAAAQRSETGQGTWPHEKSDLDPDPEAVFGRLENGFKYILMQNSNPEDRVKMHLVVEAGSFHEKEDERGIAHFLEHMLFNGTESFPPGELIKYFQRIGMDFGPDVNGRTGFYNTVYDLDLPDGRADMLEEALLVMYEYGSKALLKQEEVIQERSVILSEKRTRDSPDYRTFKKTFGFELPDARISERLPIGKESVIKNTGRDKLKDFYDTWYRPERLTLIMVGDFDPSQAEEMIAGRFSGMEARASRKPDPEFGTVEHEGIKPLFHHESEAGQTRVAIETVEKKPLEEDGSDYREKRLLAQMANAAVKHRIDEIVEEKDAPFTRADISSGHYLKFVKSAEISAQCDPGDWKGALSAIEQVLRRAVDHGFTDSETARVKKEFESRLEKNARKADTRKSGHITRDIMKKLGENRVFQSPEQQKQLLLPAIEEATPHSLHKALKEEWSSDHRLVMVTGNAEISGTDGSPEEKIRQEFEKSRQKKVEKPAEEKKVEFPYLIPPAGKARIEKKQEIPDLGVTRVDFENGFTLFMKKTDFDDDQVLAAASFGRGESTEPQQNPALAEMTEEVLNLSGLGQLSRQSLKRALAGKNTSVSFNAEEDRFVLSASSVPDETRLMFELLYAYVKDPGFRSSALSRAKNRFRQHYESLSHSVEGAMELEGMRFLAGGDGRFGLAPLEAVENTELEEIKDWIKPVLENEPIEMAVVGDFDPDKVMDAASRFFGTLPPAAGTCGPADMRQPVFPKGEELEISVPTRMSKAMLVSAYPTTDTWDINETRRLSILSRIFSDRMRLKIREEMGDSYAQQAFNRPSRAYPGYGILAAYTITDPQSTSGVRTALEEIASELQKNGADEDELKRALEPTLTGIRQQLQTNEYWLDTVLTGASRHPLQLHWSRTIKEDYENINVEEINRAAEKYLENEASANIIITPGDNSKK